MSSWRDPYFGRRSAVTRAGLIQAPRREQPSHELIAGREQEQKEREHERAIYQRIGDEERAARRQRYVEALRPLVEAFGAEAVVRISRRSDPGFELPAELLGEDTDGH